MEALKVKWYARAIRQNTTIAEWYQREMGQKAAVKYMEGIAQTIQTLSFSPQIGRVDQRRSTSSITYYSFLSYKYRIVYRFSETTLFIVGIRSTAMIRL